ncbi:hypothetical protein, partial [Bacteroides uniformis]|nr:hypothetical protein [Bacteroides uniformis]
DSIWAVVAKPKISVSTPTILRQINYEKLQHLDVDSLVDCIQNGRWQESFVYMGNVLEPVTMREYPEIRQLKKRMEKLGADVV